MSKLTNLLIFITGASVGSAVAWKLLKTKYERIAQEEIDSVKEVYYGKPRNLTRRNDESNEEFDCEKKEIKDFKQERMEDFKKYGSIIQNNEYSQYSKNKEKEVEDLEKPYVIPPEEFSIYADYDTISLTYYTDGVVADDEDEVMGEEDVDAAIGLDALNHFGEFEDDSVYVRNDKRKCDYEILLDNRKYSDVVKSKPYLKEDQWN